MKKYFLAMTLISYFIFIFSASLGGYFISNYGIILSVFQGIFFGVGCLMLYFFLLIGVKYQFQHEFNDIEEIYREPVMPLFILSIGYFCSVLLSLPNIIL
jgi:hypothetical protein